MLSALIEDNNAFRMFSAEHATVVILSVVFGVLFIWWAKKQSAATQNLAGILLAGTISSTVIVWTLIKLAIGTFSLEFDLPLHLCNFMAALATVIAVTRSKWLFEVSYFWVMAGTVQAVATPDLYHSFPNFNFLKFWIVHSGMVIYMLYMIFVQNMRPTGMSVLKSFGALLAFAIVLYFVNSALGSNYMFLQYKPPGGSLLDIFGPWPNYIVAVTLIVLPFFFLLYLPFYFCKKNTCESKA